VSVPVGRKSGGCHGVGGFVHVINNNIKRNTEHMNELFYEIVVLDEKTNHYVNGF
jgi:hypothetical protein